jgi:hypothetical protein
MKNNIFLVLSLIFVHFASAQTTYFSKAGTTNFNDPATWNTVADGSGTDATAITNADVFTVTNNAQLVLGANAAVGNLTFTLGKLTIAANTLTVGFAGKNNSTMNFPSGGFLEITGGTLDVRGAMYFQTGSGLKQTGGLIKIDGNSGGVVANSIAGGRMFLGFGIPPTGGNTVNTFDLTAASAANFILTGGTIQIVDGTAATAGYDLIGFRSTGTGTAPINILCGTGHTFEFGDGSSTDPVGNAEGLLANVNMAGGFLSFGKLVINIAGGQNRFLKTKNNFYIRGNLEVVKGALIVASGLYLEGNLINNDSVITTSTFSFQKYTGITAAPVLPVTTPQTITGTGKFLNNYTTPTANFFNLTFNNRQTPAAAIAIPVNMISGVGTGSVSGTLRLTNGYIDIQNTPLIMGTASTSSTTAGVSVIAINNASVIGEVQHWFPSGISATKNYQVGVLGKNHNFAVQFPTAITNGGKVSVKFITTAPSTSGLPLPAEAGNNNVKIDAVSPSGYWSVEPLAGLTLGTGTYTVNANANGFLTMNGFPFPSTMGLALIKRPTGGNWAPGASGIAADAGITNFYRQNMTDFSEFAIGGNAKALPFYLLSFEGKANGLQNNLYWKTAYETDSDKFIIERSTDGTNFTSVGVVNSKAINGISSTILHYTFTDLTSGAIKHYYRLKMINKNSIFEYSNIISINQSKKSIQFIDAKPNPTNGVVKLHITGFLNKALIVVRSLTGQVMLHNKINLTSDYILNVQSLQSGTYIIEVTDLVSDQKAIQKIIKH